MKSKLVSVEDIKKGLKLRGVLGSLIASTFLCATKLSKINKRYENFGHFYGRDFTTSLLKEFDINFELNEDELEYIPQEGPFIVVANHPFGAIDGILLIHILSSIRPDIKFVTNFVLSHIPNLKEYFLPVNPFSDNKELSSSFSGLRMALNHLESGSPIVLFPAGEVSTKYNSEIVQDKQWQSTIIKMIKIAAVPVIPIYFHGHNSKLFHILGRVHPMLRTLRLPAELLNKQHSTIKLCVGKAVLNSEISEFKEIEVLGRYLRSRCYSLEANIPQIKNCPKRREDVDPIALPKNRRAMQKEINKLNPSAHLFTTGNYSCFLVDYDDIPLIMHEIGRRREEAFRAVGEGTGRPLDLDHYDTYYKHLVLWDIKNTKLVGAYRLGFGSDILISKGVKGFYTSTLFNYNSSFNSVLSSSLELGRSFVVLEYQKEALPLVLLIKGLFYSVLNNSDIKYLLGPVSISSWYPLFYRSLIVKYLKEKHGENEMTKMVLPKNPFIPDYLRSDAELLLSGKMDSIEKFDRYLLKLSNGKYRLPTLVKKYIKINCNIISFNVDPDFNFCVDGLVLLDLKNVSKDEIINLSKGEKNIDKILERFN